MICRTSDLENDPPSHLRRQQRNEQKLTKGNVSVFVRSSIVSSGCRFVSFWRNFSCFSSSSSSPADTAVSSRIAAARRVGRWGRARAQESLLDRRRPRRRSSSWYAYFSPQALPVAPLLYPALHTNTGKVNDAILRTKYAPAYHTRIFSRQHVSNMGCVLVYRLTKYICIIKIEFIDLCSVNWICIIKIDNNYR